MEQGTDAKIYGRTQQVQDVIVAGLSGINDCALVTDAHLAAITTLNLSGQGMTALRADDFAGLTHLQELRLSGNALTTLPTGVFSGLTTLQCLFLDPHPPDDAAGLRVQRPHRTGTPLSFQQRPDNTADNRVP